MSSPIHALQAYLHFRYQEGCSPQDPIVSYVGRLLDRLQVESDCPKKKNTPNNCFTQQSVANGMLGVQLELSMRLRKELNKNKKLRHDFATGLLAAYKEAFMQCGKPGRSRGGE